MRVKKRKVVDISYPPLSTKKWIPPDERVKKPKKPPRYTKPEGIHQRLAISSLRKIWHQYIYYDKTAILVGHFGQTSKKYMLKTRGLQGACNCAVACIFAYLFPMNIWDRYTIDRILDIGNDLYLKSIQQDPERCLIHVPTNKMFNSIYLDRDKISFDIDCKNMVEEKFSSVAEDKVKETIKRALENFFVHYPSGIVTMLGKYIAVWIQDEAYYAFDSTEHTPDGFPAYGIQCHVPQIERNYPRYPFRGEGFAVLYRCLSMDDLVYRLYLNLNVHVPFVTFTLEGCTVQRLIHLNVDPPERLEDLEMIKQQMLPMEQLLEKKKSEPGFDVTHDRLTTYLTELEEDQESKHMEIMELAPDVGDQLSLSKRPSWLQDAFDKADVCKYPFPYKKKPEMASFYLDLDAGGTCGIMRAGTHQTDPNFSRYKGRQSMGNAISALIMLKFHKSKVWVPALVNKILKYGDLMYRDAMVTIPRTQELKLSNFHRKTLYLEKLFTPQIEDFVVVGRLISSNFEVLDLFTALETFLINRVCCVIIGPITLAIWVEDGKFYSFDPNGRDDKGRVIRPEVLAANPTQGKACVMWFLKLTDFVNLYMDNVPKSMRSDPFYLSEVQINEYVDIPEAWYNFKGILRGMWILRGTVSQSDRKFDLLSRNFQSPAICFALLARMKTTPLKDFATETVDEILETGDRFYKESVTTLTEQEQFDNRMLMLLEINKSFKWEDKMVDFDIEECVTNGVFLCSDTNFQKAIQDYFVNYECGIITCKAMSVAFWKFENFYYYFDSHNRNEKGLYAPYGTACILRSERLDDLAQVLMANFAPTKENTYNIHYVRVTFSEMDADELIRPVMEFYKRLNENKLILRSLYSEISNKFDLNVGKQSIPMCVMALGFNKLKPSLEWNQQDLDEILNKGDVFYANCMTDILKGEETLHLAKIRTSVVTPSTMDQEVCEYEDGTESEESKKTEDTKSETRSEGQKSQDKRKSEETRKSEEVRKSEEKRKSDETRKSEETRKSDETRKSEETKRSEEEVPEGEGESAEEEEEDEHAPLKITLNNMKKEFNIGLNKFNIEIEDVARGTVRPELKEALQTFFEAPQTEEYYNQEMMILTKPYSVITWRDDHIYYIFDPKPRDKEGYVIGLEDWSELRLPKPLKEKKRRGMRRRHQPLMDEPEGADTVEHVTNYDAFVEGEGGPYNLLDYIGGEEGESSESEEREIPYPPMVHKSSSFWREKEKSGRACVIAFNRLGDLIDHIYANIPPKLTPETEFKLKSIKIINNTDLRQRFNPECERTDVYQGNWYNFEEVDQRMWILRGTMTLCNELFPAYNRGKQQLPTAYVALASAYIFTIICYNGHSVDTILKYGDKLTTFIRNYKKQQLLQIRCECNDYNRFCDDEINWILKNEGLNIADIPKRMCISKFMVNVDVESDNVVGDINAQDFEDTFDLKRGLVQFFDNFKYGLLEAKGLTVAIWRGARMYFMFDGFNRGRNGIIAPYGVACITRYLDLDRMADTFLVNLPKYGNNCFTIHGVTMTKDICPREREPKVVRPPPKTVPVGGFSEIVPGKCIVRGSIHQNDPKFEKIKNSMGAPIAIIALTMTLLHKTTTWAKPIIDEIVELGAVLYDETLEVLGFDFNPWEEKLDLAKVNTDYKIGVIKASCEVRVSDIKGIIDIKDPCTLNLRQGITKFFEENTHGVIVAEPMTVAIWEEEQDDNKPIIYIFDPNPRGPTGMPANGGTACLMSFLNPTLASEHLLGCISEPAHKMCCFEVVPVEIVVGTMKIPCKTKKDKLVTLPRCAEVSEDKKFLRKYAEGERRKKEARRLQQLGRKNFYITKSGDVLIRGYKSQNSPCFTEACRDKQDIPNCIVALVMHHLISVDRWSSKNIDLILMAGNQLYIDSYIAYGPKDLKLGMENIVRKFYLKHLTIHLTVYKPIISEIFNEETLFRVLAVFFTQEQFCVLQHLDQWVTLIFKSGQFYLFDPHERDLEGYSPKKPCCGCGAAILMRFDDISSLTTRLIENLSRKEVEVRNEPEIVGEEEECTYENENLFTLWIASVEIK